MGRTKEQASLTRFPPCPRNPDKFKDINKTLQEKGYGKALKRKPWKGVTCPVCLEVPHNSVVLLCSSYHKGCRPYMCATGNRFSNCLEQYKKAYAKDEKSDKPPELLCPLCRGQVKGWTVVEKERKYLNSKKRSCMKDKCLFYGSYRQLKKHVKEVHPRVKPRAIDPVLEAKWKKLEVERERSDVISTVMASTPGAMVFGDYVIEPYNNAYGHHDDSYEDDSESDDEMEGGLFELGSFDIGRLQPRSAAVSSRGIRSMIIRNRWVRSRGVSRRRQTQD
ncbi:unnamed protein product [Arabidopsis lyrata]|uniref:Zinc finger family protein n=1 Tax=Arabidopsis lyrata subsp. lyrata TaxID=81972 RepID=D7M8F5_ARALL|nr:uncharacterized protein LOC9308467 [Arabidopsis lyrata subsp. lyrata]XP_020877500.1 uncharacterized protein LOC9308467 [Arabidopsis lyrata subsp. lyrata]XP_020877501.1 uncharacterized protein LOC9308467 [Arabidopsis lyrata subsp. lyrata]XP_020877503.1 uncharacterized protein LOC9308467 [Arabidopsis lyrata subsp. lyrata]XP_020877504.1 uncharacterized protein LOC9308467 [Arabidopsis lyrata subsp. lyrata]XP_020877505.1 uncharacterized protein LOC9308467 [Arabidopsis lyrata subsp. lyrata]CAH82|eukprot:XP_020877499.1 uncharacterized protein LOC9308467 [Arabidopsis lyrata subsp. lyrata]